MNMAVHVDDIVGTPSSEEIRAEFDRRIRAHWGDDDITGGKETEWVLGMKVSRDWEKKTVTLSQGAFVRQMLENFGMPLDATPRDTPLPSHTRLSKWEGEACDRETFDYMMFCGCCNWLVTQTRPDLQQATNMLSRYMANPGPEHVEAARHVLHYLVGHTDLGITFHGSDEVLNQGYPHANRVIAMVDSDLGGCLDTNKSTTGYIIMLNGGPLVWKSRRQTTVAEATTEAEMKALAASCHELDWVRDAMVELGFQQGCIRIYEDNAGTVFLAHGQKETAKSANFKRSQTYVEDKVNAGEVWVDKVPTDVNIADIFTKNVEPGHKFIGLRDIAVGKAPYLYVSPEVERILANA